MAVRGVFDLDIPARRKMAELRREAQLTDRAVDKLGRSLDRVGGPTVTRRIGAVGGAMRTVGRDARLMERQVSTSWRGTQRQVERSSRRIQAEVGAARREVREFGRTRAKATVGVDGAARATAEVEALHRRVKALGRERAFAKIGARDSGLSNVAQDAGQAEQSLKRAGRSARFFGMSLNAIAAGAVVALPALQALGGAAGALAGTLGGAALGGGAIGVAGGGALLTGLGGIAATALPLKKELAGAIKAHTGYRKALDSSNVAGGSASRSLNQQRSAMDQVRTAQNALSDANRQATQAQSQLTQARRDARRALVDLQLAEAQGVLGMRRSRVALTEARQRLDQVRFDPTASPTDLANASIDVSEARLGVRQALVERRRSRADLRGGQRRGVERADPVVAAKENIRQASRAQADAARQLKEAYRGVRQAQQEVASGGSTVAKAKAQWDAALKRAPAGTRQLISEARAFRSEWMKATNDSRVSLVRFLRTTVGAGRDLIPTGAEVSRISTAAAEREAGGLRRFATSADSRRFALTSARMFDENLGPVRRTTQNVVGTLMNITRASRPFLLEATQFLDRWTAGWRRSTSDIGATRKTIGGMVDDLKSVGRTGFAGFRLLKDVLTLGRPSGRNLFDSMTGWLDRTDQLVRRNPEKVRKFFRETADSTTRVARALVSIAQGLNRIATDLRPVLNRFADLTKLLGDLGVLGSPGALAFAYGGFRGIQGSLRGRRAGRGGGGAGGGGPGAGFAGAGGGLPFLFGVPGTAGPRTARQQAQIERWQRTTNQTFRPGALETSGMAGWRGSVARGAGRVGAGVRSAAASGARFALPTAALFALAAASQTPGSAVERLQAGVSGATLGIVPQPVLGGQRVQAAIRRNQEFVGRLPTDPRRQGQAIALLRRRLDLARYGDRSRAGLRAAENISGGFSDNKALQAGTAFLRAELNRRVALVKQYRAEVQRAADARSRQRGKSEFGDITEAFGIRTRAGKSPAASMRQAVSDVLKIQRGMRTSGAKILAQNTLAWAKAQAKANPALIGQYRRLEKELKDSFSRTGQHISIVNGRILTGSRQEWASIRDAMTSRAEKAREEVSNSFTAIQKQAVGSLVAMGFTKGEATKLVAGAEKSASGARALTVSQQAGATSQLTRGPGRSDAAQRKHSRGGRVVGPNWYDLGDRVQVGAGEYAAHNELYINRHTERRLNSKLAGQNTTVGLEVGKEMRGHAARMHATGGRAESRADAVLRAFERGDRRRPGRGRLRPGSGDSPALLRYLFGRRISERDHATGGRAWGAHPGAGNALPRSEMVPLGSRGPGQVIHPAIAAQAKQVLAKYRMQATAGWAPVGTHAGNSDHHWGGAMDLVPGGGSGGSWGWVDKAARWAEPSQNHPAHGFRWVGYNGDPGHGRGNHLHLSWTFGKMIEGLRGGGAGGMAAGGTGRQARIPLIALGGSRLGGSPGGISNAARALVAGGYTQMVNRYLRRKGVTEPGGGTSGRAPTGRGATVTASWYSGSSGSFGALHEPYWAELSDPPGSLNWSALAHAMGRHNEYPANTMIRVTGPRGSAEGPKRDRGKGGPGVGGRIRAVDLSPGMAEKTGVKSAGLANVKVQVLDGKRRRALGGRASRWAGSFRDGTSFQTRAGRGVVFEAGEGGSREQVDVTPLSGPGSQPNRAGGRSTGGHVFHVPVDLRGSVIASKADADALAERVGEKVAAKILDAIERHGSNGGRSR